ncbi:DNA polymerase nu [Tachysurus vachellii]|uniref:DNA polymerase nu n=1 Tax=Tachysurus vachellii TaxID=175792 RepID=UPI00296A9386|nr:DNA polymerase nu [Tachysurus vachellii]
MEYHTYSPLTAGPLSSAAQMVMAALRAQYAGRIDRRPYIAVGVSQKQNNLTKTLEPHTQTNMHYVCSSSHRESIRNIPQSDLIEQHKYNTEPHLHKQRESQVFKVLSVGEMKRPSRPDLQQLHEKDNTLKQWGAEIQGDWRPRDYEDDGNLSGFNPGNNIPSPSKSPPEPSPLREELLHRNDFVNRGTLQADMGLPKTHSRTSGRKERIQLMASLEEGNKAEAITQTPPLKRWRFDNLHLPITSCSRRFEQDDSGQKSDIVKANENLEKIQFKVKTALTEEIKVDQISYGDVTEKFKYHSGTNKTLTYGSHLPVHHTLGSLRTSDSDQDTEDKEQASAVETESDKVELVRHRADVYEHQSDIKNDQLESQEISVESENSSASKVTETHQGLKTFSKGSQRSFGVKRAQNLTLPAEYNGKREPLRWSHGFPYITLSQEPCVNQTSCFSGEAEVQFIHQAQQSKATRQLLYTQKTTQNQHIMPEQTESNVDIRSNIPKAAQQRQSALELNEQIHVERDRDADKTSEQDHKCTLALISDPRVCDASRLSHEQRTRVLEEAEEARALVATMVYQDGTTQLDPEQKCPPAVCGVLVLLKKNMNSLVLETSGAAGERLLFLRLKQTPVWSQQDVKHNQDLFTREILVKMVCGTHILVCYKSKDLLRTALRHFNKDLTWKQVASCQVLDPQIAAWLLDPADSASCFQELFKKYCSHPTTHPLTQSELRNQKVTHVISSLAQLHRVMVELRNKLEIQGLWQLYVCMEQKMMPVLAAMESHRIHVDKEALKETSELLGTKMKQLEQQAHQTAGQKFLVSSSSQLRQVLFEKLRLHARCENKKLPKTLLKQQQSTSEAVLLQLQDLHPLPRIVLEYRQVHKIKSTFLDGILSCMKKTYISSTWNQTSTVSGRLSAKHPNFQALPRQPVQISKQAHSAGKEAELITVHPRTMFIAREGWTFLSADFCQMELRLLAHLSSDPELLRIFQNAKADVFNMLASQWKSVSEDSVSAEDREQTKRIVYSVVYGAGKARLSRILGVSAEEASHFQDSFLQKYKEVQAFIQCTVQHCHKYGYVKSIMGRRRSLPHIHSGDWGIRNQAERQAVNFVVQGSAADLCKMAMIHICSLLASSTTLTPRLVAQIHDELLFEVEDSQVAEFAVLVKKTMESLQHISCLGVSLTVPLKVSVSTGRSWGSMCEVNLPHADTTHTTV